MGAYVFYAATLVDTHANPEYIQIASCDDRRHHTPGSFPRKAEANNMFLALLHSVTFSFLWVQLVKFSRYVFYFVPSFLSARIRCALSLYLCSCRSWLRFGKLSMEENSMVLFFVFFGLPRWMNLQCYHDQSSACNHTDGLHNLFLDPLHNRQCSVPDGSVVYGRSKLIQREKRTNCPRWLPSITCIIKHHCYLF